MKKILLLNPPYKEPIIRDNYCCFTSKSGYIWPPVDLLYLSGILRSKKTEVEVIDAVINGLEWKNVLNRIETSKPDIIVSLTGTVSFKDDLEGLSKIKKSEIYLMGNTPAFKPDFFLKHFPFVKGIIHNFFDTSIFDFLIDHDKKSPSISYRIGKKGYKIGSINAYKYLSEISLPNTPQHNLFPMKLYSTPIMKNKPMTTMMTSFGCPFNCKFCIASSLSYYKRKLIDLKHEFDAIKKSGIKEIFFEDSTFNSYIPYTESICKLLIKERYGFTWSANIHSFNLTKKLLKLMKKAGCHTVQIGVESGSKEILLEYAPSKKIETLKNAFKLAKEAGIKTLGYFIVGFPKESASQAKKTIDFSNTLSPDYASFSIMTPDYGTKLYDEAVSSKMIKKNGIFTFDSSGEAVLKNPLFSRKAQDEIVKKAYINFYSNPKRILSYLKDYRKISLYIKNGLHLLFKKII
jgi:radical SAM superfamily enzyme YgiQ (UPF0313 family)